MKKILTLAVASIAVAAIADNFSPDIGVTTLWLSLKNNVIPVQFNSLADSGPVKAGDLVCTNNIPLNSYLFVYNDGSYTAWRLVESGWNPLDVASGTAEAAGITYGGNADEVSLSAGSAIWLSFPEAQSPAKLVSFYGKVASETNTVISANKSTLVCNMTGSEKSISTLLSGVSPQKGDKIRLVTETYQGEYSYNPNGEEGKKWKNFFLSGESQTTLPTLGAYQGFWYLSKGGSGSITW